MKKNILFLFLIFSMASYAQEVSMKKQKLFTFGLQVEQNFQLNNWFNDKEYNGYMSSLDATNISLRGQLHVFKNFGLWVSMGLDRVNSKSKNVPDVFNAFENIDLSNYYISDVYNDKSSGYELDVVSMMGFFYQYKHKEWIFTPSIGYGANVDMESLYSGYSSYSLKEKGVSNKYSISNLWNSHDDLIDPLDFIVCQFRTDLNVFKKLNVTLGVSYRQYLRRSIFTATMSDFYNNTLIEEKVTKGNLPRTLGVSVGISF